MSWLISFVLTDSSCEPCEGCENYKMKNSCPQRDSIPISLAYLTGTLTDWALGSVLAVDIYRWTILPNLAVVFMTSCTLVHIALISILFNIYISSCPHQHMTWHCCRENWTENVKVTREMKISHMSFQTQQVHGKCIIPHNPLTWKTKFKICVMP